MSTVRPGDRRVRRLAVGATEPALARRGALLVEDALRTASLPADGVAGARVLVVRSLALGRISPDAPPTTVALEIEERLRELAARAVSARDPSAPAAAAVYFDDPLQPLVRLATRIAARQRVDEWFWPLAVPVWRPDLPRPDALRALLAAALDVGSGAVGQALIVRALMRQGTLDELVSALRWQDGQELLRRSGWAEVPGAVADDVAPLLAGEPARRAVAAWAARLGAEDARVIWLAAALAVAERPTRAADPRLPARARAEATALLAGRAPEPDLAGDVVVERPRVAAQPAPAAVAGQRGRPERKGRPSGRGVGDAAGETVVRVAEAGEVATPQERTGAASVGPAPGGQSRGVSARPLSQEEEPQPSAAARRADAVPRMVRTAALPEAESTTTYGERVNSGYAGLFYLLPLLRRLGFVRLLEEEPELVERELPARLLRHIARRVGAPPEDPVYAALPAGEPADDADLAAVLAQWTTRLRRWCRRHAEMGLVSLVRRPGTLSFTRTHLDVFFSLRQVDLRIRKAGLDVDPGWLPWLGRVVAFHYEPGGHPRG